MKTISIFGAGLSGLTVAHELVDLGYTVTVYEKDASAGGMAKSKRDTEHSWRGYAPFYYNTFDILSRIPSPGLSGSGSGLSGSGQEHFTNETVYSLETVQMKTTESQLWTYYNGNVYDITEWVRLHPGGRIILRAGGKNLESVLKAHGLEWHLKSKRVMETLEGYRIGRLGPEKEHFTGGFGTPLAGSGVRPPGSLLETVFSKRKIRFELLSDSGVSAGIHPLDYPYLWYLMAKYGVSPDDSYSTRVVDLLRGRVHTSTYNYLVYFGAGPGFGLDLNTASFGHYAKVIWNVLAKGGEWSVASGPTSEVFIDPWVKYLESRGVTFKFNCKLLFVNTTGNAVKNCTVNWDTGVSSTVTSDTYVLCINPNVTKDVFGRGGELYTQFERLATVNNQLGFVIRFNKRVTLAPNVGTAFVLMDSYLNITFYAQDLHWDDKFNTETSLWSGTCVQLSGKRSDTREHLKSEIASEFWKSKDLARIAPDFKTAFVDIEVYDEWDTEIVSKNPKWVNNTDNEKYRPDVRTHLSNMFLSGAHVKNSIGVWSMEGAIESGKRTAAAIADAPVKIYDHTIHLPFGRLLKGLNAVLKRNGLLDVVDTLVLLVVIMVIYRFV